MKTGSKVKQGDPTSLSTEGVHPLLDTRGLTLRHKTVGNQATPVLPITRSQNNQTFCRFLCFPSQLGNRSRVHIPTIQRKNCHANSSHFRKEGSQLGREWPNCRARFRSSSQSSMRQKPTGNEISSINHRAGRTFSFSIEIVNTSSTAERTIPVWGYSNPVGSGGHRLLPLCKSSAPNRNFWELPRQTFRFRFRQLIATCQAAELREL